MASRERAAEKRALAKAFVREVNAHTVCAHCGAQPIEWHNPDHVTMNRQDYRIGRMANIGQPIEKIQTEMVACTPLCRRCHVIEDGRAAVFTPSLPGELNPSAKLVEEQVREIRALRKTGLTWVAIGAKFGITNTAARFAGTGKTWRHVQ